MPYRVDIHEPRDEAFERLVDLGAIDVEEIADGTLAALLPDDVEPDRVAEAAGSVVVSPGVGRDDGSVWVLRPRPVRIAGLLLAPVTEPAAPDTIRLVDAGAFGTGLHPTTALCLEIVRDLVDLTRPAAMLDVGTGSGVLALAALHFGVPRATGLDIEEHAVRVAGENASLNGLADRLTLVHGGPDAVDGRWPLVVANVLVAPLIEMAPVLAHRVAHGGVLVLSGITERMAADVDRAYRRVGMHPALTRERDGWVALEHRVTW